LCLSFRLFRGTNKSHPNRLFERSFMSNTQHTPGPWLHVKADECHGHYIEDATGETVCDLYFVTSSRHEFSNAELNARLIAAAPDLLEALAAIVEALDEIGGHQRLVRVGHAAIGKATGSAA
jgi:hypothetical protein